MHEKHQKRFEKMKVAVVGVEYGGLDCIYCLRITTQTFQMNISLVNIRLCISNMQIR